MSSEAAESRQDTNDEANVAERKYWEQTFNIINSSQNYVISNEQLRLILSKVKKW
jgi:hypothetical protein